MADRNPLTQEIKVNNKRARNSTWIRTVLERLKDFETVEVKAMGVAISNAIYAAKAAEEKQMGSIVKIDTDVIQGYGTKTASINITLKRTEDFFKIFKDNPVPQNKIQAQE